MGSFMVNARITKRSTLALARPKKVKKVKKVTFHESDPFLERPFSGIPWLLFIEKH